VLAIMTVETGLWCGTQKQTSIRSSATAAGLMQIMPVAAQQYRRDYARMSDPAENVDTGAEILADHRRRFGSEGLPRIAAAYNAGPGGGCAPRNEWNLKADANYPRQAIQYNNAALLYLGVGRRGAGLATVAGMGMALGGVAVAAAIMLGRLDPRRVPVLRRFL